MGPERKVYKRLGKGHKRFPAFCVHLDSDSKQCSIRNQQSFDAAFWNRLLPSSKHQGKTSDDDRSNLEIMQTNVVDSSLEQIAVLYLAQRKGISLGPFIVASVSNVALAGVTSLILRLQTVSRRLFPVGSRDGPRHSPGIPESTLTPPLEMLSGMFLMQVGSYVSALSRQKDGWFQQGIVFGVLTLNM